MKIIELIKKYLLIIFGFIVGLLPFFYYFFGKGIGFKFITIPLSKNILYVEVIPFFLFILKFLKNTSKIILLGNFLLWFLFIISFVILFLKIIKNIKKKREKINKNYILLIFWFIFAFIGVCSGKRFFGHYFIQVLPVVSILASFSLAMLLNEIKKDIFKITHIFIVIIIILGFIIPIFQYPILYLESHFTFKDFFSQKPTKNELIGEYIKKNSKENDTILIWGYDMEIYYFSERKPATKFVTLEEITGFTASGRKRKVFEKDKKLFIEELKKNKPRYIVDTSLVPKNIWSEFTIDKFEELDSFVKESYKLEATANKIKIYRRIY